MLDDKMKTGVNSDTVIETDIEISEKQIELFARRLLPEIKQYFADEDIKQEFEIWQKKGKAKV